MTPTPTPREALAELVAAIDARHSAVSDQSNDIQVPGAVANFWRKVEAAREALAQSPSPVQAEPVAWLPIETAPKSFHPPLSPINHHAPDILGLWGESFYCVCSWGGPSQPFWIGSDNKKVPFQPTRWVPLPTPTEKPSQAQPLCMCKDRAASACPGEWEPGCDLGSNPAFVRVSQAQPPAQAGVRCPYCDGTGDVHSPTGEWRGVCTSCLATPASHSPAEGALPERDATKPAEAQGLFRKFNVSRTDGSDSPGGKHEGCEYFVLDVAHDKHAAAALAAYATDVEASHPHLAADMRERYRLPLQTARAVEAAPEPASNSPFDAALGKYAGAVWHHDMAGMRAGYAELSELFAGRLKVEAAQATQAVEEGCTPADARMLRAANHGLADESHELQEVLADLYLQVKRFCEAEGEADFETGRALHLLSRLRPMEFTWPFATEPPSPAAQASPEVEGWKWVPVEATKEMCVAAVKYANGNAVYKNVAAGALEIEESIYGEAYAAMLAATPSPSAVPPKAP